MAGEEAKDIAPVSQQEAQAQGVKRFFASGTFSDLTIACNGREWQVHKTQVCAQSELFYKMCTSEFTEAKQNKITLDHDDPDVVGALIHYMYHGTYIDPNHTSQDLPPMVLDVKMFVAADKYFVEPLATLACEMFTDHCADGWKSAEFAMAVREVYEGEVDKDLLKDIVMKTLKEHANEVLSKADDYPELVRAMSTIPALSTDLLMWLASSGHRFDVKTPNKRHGQYQCPNCHCVRIPQASFGYTDGTCGNCGVYDVDIIQ